MAIPINATGTDVQTALETIPLLAPSAPVGGGEVVPTIHVAAPQAAPGL